MFGGFEDVVEDVDDVFALVAFAVIGAGAGGDVGNCDGVDVAGCAGHGDCFRGVCRVVDITSAIDDEHPGFVC